MMKRVLVVAADADDAILYGSANKDPDGRHLSFIWDGHTDNLTGEYDAVVYTYAASYEPTYALLYGAAQQRVRPNK